MNKKESRKVFTKEFKEEIVFLVTDKGRKPSELAREFSINRNTIDRWVRELKAAGEEAFPGDGNLGAAQAEIQRLKRELASAREDREILKKALAFFSKHSK